MTTATEITPIEQWREPMLADEVLAARGDRCDTGGLITSVVGANEKAHRFNLYDDWEG